MQPAPSISEHATAAIVGIAGTSLGADEARMLREGNPLGVILFRRNIETSAQLADLVGSVRACLGSGALLLVDQEGGRVARLRPPGWLAHPPASALGALYLRDPAAGVRAAWLTGALIGLDCAGAGFDVACAPVLDRGLPGAHAVIGDRAFGADADVIIPLAGAVAEGLLAAGIQPVGKHVPGHGRARADSHFELPELERIEQADLAPFAALSWLPWLMTAHIRYRDADAHRPATLSPAILRDIVRGRLGFHNMLISDDLAMQALEGTPGLRAAEALAAGCDVALHCSGILEDSLDVLRQAAPLTPQAALRLDRARTLAGSRRLALDASQLGLEREALLC